MGKLRNPPHSGKEKGGLTVQPGINRFQVSSDDPGIVFGKGDTPVLEVPTVFAAIPEAGRQGAGRHRIVTPSGLIHGDVRSY